MKLSIFGEYGGVGISRTHLGINLMKLIALRMRRMKLSALGESAE
jgi:hypothetical protein